MIGLWVGAAALAVDCAALDDGGSGHPVAGLPSGPVRASLLDGGLGSARRACPRTGWAVAPRGYLLVDTPNFYGHVVAGLNVDGSLRIGSRNEVFARLELLRYDSVISAVSASSLTPGHTTIGATRLLVDEGIVVSTTAKVVLPTAVGLYRNAWPVGIDAGLTAQWFDGPWEVHGQMTLLGSAALSRGPAFPRGGIAPVIGGSVRPTPGFAVVVDIQASFGYTAPVDVIALAPALRFGWSDHVGTEIGATLPLAGRERALAAVELRITWRSFNSFE